MKIKLLLSLMLLLMLGSLSFVPVRAQGGTTIWVDPKYNYYGVGETFSIDVKIADAQNLMAWQVQLSYNASVLNVLNVTAPPDYIFNGLRRTNMAVYVNTTGGFVLHGSCLLNGGNVSGSGGLSRITFMVVAPGQSILKIDTRTFLLDPAINFITFTSYDGYHHNHLLGDLTGPNSKPDGKVDIRDIAFVAQVFGKPITPGDPRDLNQDGKIDIKDVATVAKNFGQRWP